jgi:hypothetical protein
MYVCKPGKEMKEIKYKHGIIVGIAVLLLATSIAPLSQGQTPTATEQKNITSIPVVSTEKTSTMSLTVFGKKTIEKQDIQLSTADMQRIYEKYQELKTAMSANPFSQKTFSLQQDFLSLLEEKQALPQGVQKSQLLALIQPSITPPAHLRAGITPFGSKAAEWTCTFLSEGSGTVLPVIILPRFIPILLTPIPRVFLRWNVKEGFTSCGGLRSGTGFIAYGQQKGVALGFWGIGLTFSLPPLMNMYGIIGYALYATVSADRIDHYPPNNPPEITQTDPTDGEQLVPLTTTELRLAISDLDGDLMSYNVSTSPDIGSGSAGLKPDGTYSIPISGLESLTTYTWHIQVTDGKDTTEKTCTFTTEPVAPVITNPLPPDGERDVPMDTPSLQFHIRDYQGDTMDYTVETAPNIGSAHADGIHDSTITVPISGLTYGATYRWYVNATDGIYWTRKAYIFETGYPSQYNPFEYGWQYRKQITINHTQVAEDLENYPILVSTADADLIKAQANGNDILFMNGAGVASRLYHDIDTFDQSTGTLAAFVKIPALSSAQDTIIYLYYGNPSSINQAYPDRVWNSDFKAVWHLSENPSGIIHDSTSNANDATSHDSMDASNVIQGRVGKALSFNGINEYLTVPDSSSLKPTEVTLLCWLNSEAEYNGRATLGKGCTDMWGNQDAVTYSFQYTNGQLGANAEKDDNTETFAKYDATTDTWYQAVMTYDSATNNIQYYQNGELRDTINHGQSLRYYGPWDFVFAAGHVGTGGGINYYVQCQIDEVWVLDTHVSDGWISTCYQNQNNPVGFMNIGPEETGP